MFTNRISKIVVVLLALAVIFINVSFITRSTAASTFRAYDSIEQVHAFRSFTYIPSIANYDAIEKIRAGRALNPVASGYEVLEQLRNARGLTADRSYDQIEHVRTERYDQTALIQDINCQSDECYFPLPNGLWVK